MDEKSKMLLNQLRRQDPRDLDEDELSTLTHLEQLEEAEEGSAATVEDAIRAGAGRENEGRLRCPKCKSFEISYRLLQYKTIYKCEECGNSWKGGPGCVVSKTVPPPGTTRGPFASPVSRTTIQPTFPSRFRDPRKVRG